MTRSAARGMDPDASATDAEAEARLSFRVPASAKALIERAAFYKGESMTSYALSRLVRDAKEDIREHEVTVLSQRDREAFLDLLDNPPAPNARLRRADARYREMVVPRRKPLR